MAKRGKSGGTDGAESGREAKRQTTLRRIAEVGQKLFLTRGYEETTLEDIAEAAGISRRTFFAYFRSKDDVIFYWLRTDSAELLAELLETSPDARPLDAVRDLMVRRVARYTSDEMKAIDDLMLSSESLRTRKEAWHGEQEQALFEALCQVWRQPERRTALRMVAMASIGAMKIALQAWREQTGKRDSAGKFLREAFDSLKTGL